MLALNSSSIRHSAEFWLGLAALCCGLTLPMMCIVWSSLVLYLTLVLVGKLHQILSRISLEMCELIPDSSHVFLKIEHEAVLYIGIAHWLVFTWGQHSSWQGHLCATPSVSTDLSESCLSLLCAGAFTQDILRARDHFGLGKCHGNHGTLSPDTCCGVSSSLTVNWHWHEPTQAYDWNFPYERMLRS